MHDHVEPKADPEHEAAAAHAAAQATFKALTIVAVVMIAITAALGLILIGQTHDALGDSATFAYGVALVHASLLMLATAALTIGLGLLTGLSAHLRRLLVEMLAALVRIERPDRRVEAIERLLIEALDSLSELRREVAELRRVVTDHDARMSAAERQHREMLTDQADTTRKIAAAAEDELAEQREAHNHGHGPQ